MKNILIILTILLFSCQKEDIKPELKTMESYIILTSTNEDCTLLIEGTKISMNNQERRIYFNETPAVFKSDKKVTITTKYKKSVLVNEIDENDSLLLSVVNDKLLKLEN